MNDLSRSIRRKKQRKRLIRQCQFPREIDLPGENGRQVSFPTPCRKCWACVANQKDQLIGRIASHAIGCGELLFFTLTYDDNKTPEAWAGARQRNVRHVQLFKKLVRKRETDALENYNRKEALDAATQGREPRLVSDPKKSRMKFVEAYEFGEKKGRGHFHMLCLLESHIPVPQSAYDAGSIRSGMRQALRVWDFPQVYGPRAARRADTLADDPAVYDHRADGNQRWSAWPHGQVRIDSITHDVAHPSGHKLLAEKLDLAPAIKYATKYVAKGQADRPEGWHWDQKRWTEQQVEEFLAIPRPSLVRTMSQGIGYSFAQAYGEKHASMGVSPEFTFRLEEILAPRKNFSAEQYEQKLHSRGVDPMIATQLAERRQQFEMTGGFRRAAFAAYHQIATEKYGDTVEGKGGDAYRRDLHQLETKKHCELLRSYEYQLALALQPKHLAELWLLYEALPAVPVYEDHPETGEPMKGPGKMNTVYRSPQDRLSDRRRQIAGNLRSYAETQSWLADCPKLDAVAHYVSCTPLDDMDTRRRREQSAAQAVERKLSANEQDRFDKALAECAAGKIEDFHLWDERERALRASVWRMDYASSDFPLDSLMHPLMPTKRLWRLVNGSHDYRFPVLREQLIERYCVVEYLDHDTRLVDNPSGTQTYLQRRQHTDEPHKNYFPEKKLIRKARKTTIWRSRLVDPDEYRRVKAGEVLLVSASHNDPVFTGECPLSPN